MANGVTDPDQYSSNKEDKVENKLNLIDLNFDCLEGICNYLRGEDLVNLAHANTHLTEAADYALREKFIHITDRIELRESQIKSNGLRIIDPLSGRVFMTSKTFRSDIPIIGGGIKHLSIDFYSIKDFDGLLEDIMKYFSDELISLEFYNFFGSTPTLHESFSKVEHVAIYIPTYKNSD